MTTEAAGRRRSQEERSAATRERILDATVECLMTYGYAGTTTPRVAETAGLTRGAQVHHFGSKNDLIIAAVQHLATKLVAAAVPRFVGVMTSDDPLGTILDLLWDIHSGPIFVPIVELWVAGRTDPTLRDEVARFEDIVVTAILGTAAKVVPVEIHEPMLDFMYTAMDALRGILLSSFVESDPTRARRRWERASTALRRIADPAIVNWRANDR